MKIRWIFTFLPFAIFFAMSDVVYGEVEQQCQPEAVVFFGNGVWNDVENARLSSKTLQNRLNAHISGTSLDDTLTYGLACNPSEGALKDLLETFEQDLQTNYSLFWNYLAEWDTMPDFLQDRIIEITNEVDAAVVSANPSV